MILYKIVPTNISLILLYLRQIHNYNYLSNKSAIKIIKLTKTKDTTQNINRMDATSPPPPNFIANDEIVDYWTYLKSVSLNNVIFSIICLNINIYANFFY